MAVMLSGKTRFSALVLAAGIACAGVQSAHAAAMYAYAQQSTSGYSFSGGSFGAFAGNTHTSAAQNASPTGNQAQSGTLDALESYVGPAAGKPAENTFTPKGQTGADYSRGDALMANGPTTNNAAELYLGLSGDSSASGSWAFSEPFSVASNGAVTISFNYANQLTLQHGGGAGTTQASYSYDLNILDASGISIFRSAPTVTNQTAGLFSLDSLSSTSSGTVSLTSPTLASGNYTLSVAGTETVFANAVPEPANAGLLALAATGLTTMTRRRRRLVR
jgi:hypothetical protein